ncbi:MAG: hypothetical protein ACPF9W_02870, partial [Nocardioides sp.]
EIAIELLADLAKVDAELSARAASAGQIQIMTALAKDADRAVDEVAPGPGETPDVAALLRAALRALSKA